MSQQPPPVVTTENVLVWLDQIRDMLDGQHPALLEPQFLRVKQFLVALTNANREGLKFATTELLFRELSSRFPAAIFVASEQPSQRSDEEQYAWFTHGPRSCCIALSQILTHMLFNKVFKQRQSGEDLFGAGEGARQS